MAREVCVRAGSGRTGAGRDTSLGAVVGRVLTLAPAVAGAGAWRFARSVADGLPASLAEWLYFEDTGPDRPLDFIIGVDRSGGELLAGRRPAPPWAGGLDEPGWRPLRAVARRWADEPALAVVERLWIELDAPRAGADRPAAPGLFLDLSPAALRRGPALAAGLASRLATQGGGPGFGARARRAIDAVVQRLPPGVVVPYVAVFPDRSSVTVRLCLLGIEPARLPGLLHDLDWPGPKQRLRDVVRSLGAIWNGHADAGCSTIHLDFAPELGSRIGLEYALDRRAQLRGTIAEHSFLVHLVRTGLLAEATLERCTAWPAWARIRVRGRADPVHVIRRVPHVKVVIDPHTTTAKAYLAARVA